VLVEFKWQDTVSVIVIVIDYTSHFKCARIMYWLSIIMSHDVKIMPTQIRKRGCTVLRDPPSLTAKSQRAVRSRSWKHSETTMEPFSKLVPGFNMDVGLHFLKFTCKQQLGCICIWLKAGTGGNKWNVQLVPYILKWYSLDFVPVKLGKGIERHGGFHKWGIPKMDDL
jgi:hypothetical protein